MCILEREKDPINPGVRTLEGHNLITVPEALNLSQKLKEKSQIKLVVKLCQESIERAKVLLKLDFPTTSIET